MITLVHYLIKNISPPLSLSSSIMKTNYLIFYEQKNHSLISQAPWKQLSELKHSQDEADDRNHDELGRYWALLGRKGHFGLHATVAVVSYIFFGLLPPLVYGFTYRETDNSEYKLIAVAITSLVCIAILSIGKAHVRPNRTYFTTMLYYLTIGVSASGLSYVAGMLLKQLVESLGLFDQGSLPAPSPPNIIGGTNLRVPSWTSF